MGESETVKLNKAYFDEQAAIYDKKHGATIEQLIKAIRARRDFIGVQWVEDDEDDEAGENGGPVEEGEPQRSVRLLDYACGPGTVTKALAPYVTRCVGVDLSEVMVAVYNTRAENQGLTEDEVHAYHGNLADPSDPDPAALAGPAFRDFDLAAVGLGFHHFDDPALAARRLAARLRPGGVLLIIDFLAYEPGPEELGPGAATVTHHGFTEARVRDIFEGAGVGGGFALQAVSGVVFPGKQETRTTLFMARGAKV